MRIQTTARKFGKVTISVIVSAVVVKVALCSYGPLEIVLDDGFVLREPAWREDDELLPILRSHIEISNKTILGQRETDKPPLVLKGPEGLVYVYHPDQPLWSIEEGLQRLYQPDIAAAIMRGDYANELTYDARKLAMALSGTSNDLINALEQTPSFVARKAFADALFENEKKRSARLMAQAPLVLKTAEQLLAEKRERQVNRADRLCALLRGCVMR